jgi:hypothetical protein
MADFDESVPQNACLASVALPQGLQSIEDRRVALAGGTIVKHGWFRIVGAALLAGTVFSIPRISQTAQTAQAPGPYARIAIMRALDGHAVELEAGYIRHLEWHRQAKDTFGWYSYSVWASGERQRWIIYATFGHTATELSNPVSPAEDERDNLINVLPHAQFLGNGVYEFLPALSRGNGVPTPTLRAEYTTVELNQGASKAFEAALAAEQSKLQGETLWYRMVVGGNTPTYVRLRPRTSLAAILDERADQALPDKVNGLISKVTVETLNLRTNMLVNVTPEPAR